MRIWIILAVSVLCGTAWGKAMTLEMVQDELAEKWEGTHGFRADMSLEMDVSRKGVRIHSEMGGPILFAKDGEGRMRQRSEIKGKVGGGPMNLLRMNTSILSVSDGEITWTEVRMMGQVRVTKMKAGKAQSESDTRVSGGREALDEFNKKYNLRLLPQRSHEGRGVYVLEGRPRPEEGGDLPSLDRVLLFFDKASGLLTTLAMLDEENKPLIELKFRNVERNPEVPAEVFEYSPPPGVEIVDKTQEEDLAKPEAELEPAP